MAGIGLRLQAFAEKGYLQSSTAFVSSALINAGPWLSGVGTLAVVQRVTAHILTPADYTTLFATVVTCFVVSMLIATGPQIMITRFLADRLYLEDRDAIAPTLGGVLCLSLPLLLIALPFVLWAPFSLPYRLLASMLYVVLCLNWFVTVFLTAMHDYWRVLIILSIGNLGGIALTMGGAHALGPLGALGGYLLGQLISVVLMALSVLADFSGTISLRLDFLRYFIQFWDLGVIGTLYALGLWIDSVIIWFSPLGQVTAGIFHNAPTYDAMKFYCYFVTIPGMAVFLVQLETRFYQHYRAFYATINERGTLGQIRQARDGMLAAVQHALETLVKLQGGVALLVCLLAPDLISWLGFGARWAPLLGVLAVTTSLQVFVMIAMLLLLYIDQRRAALLLVATYAGLNALLTGALHAQTYMLGWGHLGAALVSAFLGWRLVLNRISRLDVLTFMTHTLE